MMMFLDRVGHYFMLSIASAQCFGIDGCRADANQVIPAIEVAATILVEAIAGLAVMFVLVGGAQMLVALGNESVSSRGRMGVIYALIGFALALASQAIISFVVDRTSVVEGREFDPHIAFMELVVESALWIFNVTFALVAVYSGFRLLFFAPDSGAVEQLKKMLLFAIAGAIVVNLSYALVNATLLLFQ